MTIQFSPQRLKKDAVLQRMSDKRFFHVRGVTEHSSTLSTDNERALIPVVTVPNATIIRNFTLFGQE